MGHIYHMHIGEDRRLLPKGHPAPQGRLITAVLSMQTARPSSVLTGRLCTRVLLFTTRMQVLHASW